MQAPQTRERADKLAHSLRTILSRAGHPIPLGRCKEALAQAFGRRGWHDLLTNLQKREPAGAWNPDRAWPALRIDQAVGMLALARLALVAEPAPDDIQSALRKHEAVGLGDWARHVDEFATTPGFAHCRDAGIRLANKIAFWAERAAAGTPAGARRQQAQARLERLRDDPADPWWPVIVVCSFASHKATMASLEAMQEQMRLGTMPNDRDMAKVTEDMKRTMAGSTASDISREVTSWTEGQLASFANSLVQHVPRTVAHALGIENHAASTYYGDPDEYANPLKCEFDPAGKLMEGDMESILLDDDVPEQADVAALSPAQFATASGRLVRQEREWDGDVDHLVISYDNGGVERFDDDGQPDGPVGFVRLGRKMTRQASGDVDYGIALLAAQTAGWEEPREFANLVAALAGFQAREDLVRLAQALVAPGRTLRMVVSCAPEVPASIGRLVSETLEAVADIQDEQMADMGVRCSAAIVRDDARQSRPGRRTTH